MSLGNSGNPGNSRARAGIVLSTLLLASSCGTTSRYAFAGYRASVFAVTSTEGAPDIVADITRLNETVERARAEGRIVPPGMHAHIGFLYLLSGERDTAVAAFESERELYPESTAFIRGMLERMGASPAASR